MPRNNYLRTSALALAAMTAAVVALLVAYTPAGAARDRLPDLRMARFQNLQIQSTSDGRKLLRFDSIVVNVGVGSFEARGYRPDTSTPEMKVNQRIYNDAGGYRTRSTTARMFYAGDGHDHWHVKDLAQYLLLKKRHKKLKVVRTDAKQGFCFYDNTNRWGATSPAYYRGCANGQPDARFVTMGLSKGWGDVYEASLPGQYIDVTGLTSGRYKLRATADADNWFAESNNSNNFTWVDIQISGSSVSVIRWGPAAQPI